MATGQSLFMQGKPDNRGVTVRDGDASPRVGSFVARKNQLQPRYLASETHGLGQLQPPGLGQARDKLHETKNRGARYAGEEMLSIVSEVAQESASDLASGCHSVAPYDQ